VLVGHSNKRNVQASSTVGVWGTVVLGVVVVVLLVISAANLAVSDFWKPDAPLHAPWCRVGEVPTFKLGFGEVAAALGDVVGVPTECEHGEDASDNTFQATTTGLAVYHWCTNTPGFTRGQEHWMLTAEGVEHWMGDAEPLRPLRIVRAPDLRHLCPT
jgi:hypothetical protein